MAEVPTILLPLARLDGIQIQPRLLTIKSSVPRSWESLDESRVQWEAAVSL
jgi:hypothetical protein